MEIIEMKSKIMMSLFKDRKVLMVLCNETGFEDTEIMKILNDKNISKEALQPLYDKYLKVVESMNQTEASLVK